MAMMHLLSSPSLDCIIAEGKLIALLDAPSQQKSRGSTQPLEPGPKVMEFAFDHLQYPVERIFECIATPCGTERFPSEGQQDTCLIAATPMPLTLDQRHPPMQDVMIGCVKRVHMFGNPALQVRCNLRVLSFDLELHGFSSLIPRVTGPGFP